MRVRSLSYRSTVLIAYTNHALDHMVTSVLDARITEKIVRLGTRSADERIAQYTLDKLEKLASEAVLNRSMKRQYAKMKKLEEALTRTMTSILLPLLTWENIEQHLDIHYPDHAESLRVPPFWIAEFASQKWAEEEQEGEFQEVHRKGKKNKTIDDTVSHTLYGLWRAGADIHFIQQKPVGAASKKGKQVAVAQTPAQSLLENPTAFFESLGFVGMMPPIPNGNRPLEALLRDARVWQMSLSERVRLADEWEKKIRWLAYTSQHDHYRSLKEEYREACQEHDDMRDEVSIIPSYLLMISHGFTQARRRLLSQTDLIACTTTGEPSDHAPLSAIECTLK